MKTGGLELIQPKDLERFAQNKRSWPLEGVAQWASIAMAVKPSGRGEGDEVEFNQSPVTSSQFYSTVRDLLGSEPTMGTVSMFDGANSAGRDRHFWLTRDVDWMAETLEGHDQYTIRGPRDMMTSWSYDGFVLLPTQEETHQSR